MLLLVLAAAEALSSLRYAPREAKFASMYEYDPARRYRLRPGARERYHGHPARINRMGHRDRTIHEEKRAGTVRILVAGDSITFGSGVGQESPYPQALERRLEAARAGTRFDVINAGVPGYAIAEEYETVRLGMALDPDLVILQFTLNDVRPSYGVYADNVGAELARLGLRRDPSAVEFWLAQRSGLFLALQDAVRGVVHHDEAAGDEQGEHARIEAFVATPAGDPELERDWAAYLSRLDATVRLVRAGGAAFLLYAAPWDFQLTGATAPQERLAAFAAERGVPFVDLLPALRERCAGQEPAPCWGRWFEDHDHPNEAGHALVAEVLQGPVEALLERGR
jgi:lysophospholipase L1-like esterase